MPAGLLGPDRSTLLAAPVCSRVKDWLYCVQGFLPKPRKSLLQSARRPRKAPRAWGWRVPGPNWTPPLVPSQHPGRTLASRQAQRLNLCTQAQRRLSIYLLLIFPRIAGKWTSTCTTVPITPVACHANLVEHNKTKERHQKRLRCGRGSEFPLPTFYGVMFTHRMGLLGANTDESLSFTSSQTHSKQTWCHIKQKQ